MKRAIFIDLDGTLLKEGELHTISRTNVDAIRLAQEKEIYTIIATGRDCSMIEKVHNQIDFTDYARYIIALNGALIFDRKLSKELWSFNIPDEIFDKLVEWAKKNKYMFVISQEKKFFVNNKMRYLLLYPFYRKFEVGKYKEYQRPEYEIKKIGFFVGGRKKVLKVQNELLEKYGNDIEVVTSGKGYFLEVTAKNVSKGHAMKLLNEKLGIDNKHCAHFGDSMNDHSAMEVVGHKIAMKNADKRIIEMACHVTDDAKNHGVAKGINHLIKNKWKI